MRAFSKARKPQYSALFLISSLLIGSAILRFGMGVGPALSGEVARQIEKSSSTAEKPDDDHADRGRLQTVIDALKQRDEQLMLRDKKISDRLKALELAEAAVDRKLIALENAETRLRATLALADGASEQDLDKLTSVYEKMKPKETAALFSTMDPIFAAGFLTRMRPEAAAAILAGLTPEIAYTISVVLAGQNATAPKQ